MVRTCSRLGTGRDRMAALRIGGDHAEYHTRDRLGLIMFSVTTGKVRIRFLICGFSKRSQCRCGCKGQCTFQTVWDVIGWSLRALIARRWPKRRHDNVLFSESALPGDRERAQRAGEVIPIGAVIQKKCGDWSWMKSAVGLQGWKDGVEGRCCYGCGANCTTHPWTDPSLGASWRSTMYTRQSFLPHLMFGAIATTGIWSWLGFTINMCEWDWMHAADLGATPVT